MCRWIAYRGDTIALEHYVTEPSHSLISQSIKALESTVSTNGDGFGLGWYGEYPDPGLYREVRPAWSDENLRYLCRHIRSHLFFAHIRAATGTSITRPNCHPFVCRNWLFMHNGFVSDWNRLRRKIENFIPDEVYPARQGTTDSEAMFLAIMGAGIDRSPVDATTHILQEIKAMLSENGRKDSLRFTAALANGQDLYAFRYAVNDAPNTLYYRSAGEGVVVVSEPLDDDHASWKAVPENAVLVAEAGKKVEIFSIDEKRLQAAE